ncbi:flippase [Candidatus Uhrbacteria bacterium]|jgi:O-antigen/teichoic acid export membrane protein|nr:flippase [Candidatus Uhrbacteria bacterium]
MTQRLAKNTFYLTLASIGQKAVAFLYFALIARLMGAEDTGAYFIALAIVTVIMVLDDVGITSVLIRETAKKGEDAKMWCRTVMGIKVITMPLTVVIAFFVPVFMGYSDDVVHLVRLATIIMLADTLSLTFYGILRGLHRLKFESIGIFVGQMTTAAFGLFFLLTGSGTLPILITALIIGSSWNAIFSAVQVIRKLGWSALVPMYTLGWKPLKMAFAFFLAAVFVKVYSYTDSIILERVMGEEAVGFYAVAYKLTYAFQFLPLAFIAALYPTMSAQAKDPILLKKTLLKSFWYLMLLGAPIVFGVWSLAPEIVTFFYSEQYISSILPLQTLIFVLIFIFLDFPIGSLLNATDRQSVKTSIMGATMVVNIVGNLILIPGYEIVGASIAAIISFVFMFAAGWVAVRRVVDVSLIDLWRNIWHVMLAAILMAVVVVIAKAFIPFYFAIALGAIVYVIFGFLFGGITRDHVEQVKFLLKRGV